MLHVDPKTKLKITVLMTYLKLSDIQVEISFVDSLITRSEGLLLHSKAFFRGKQHLVGLASKSVSTIDDAKRLMIQPNPNFIVTYTHYAVLSGQLKTSQVA